MPTMRLQRLTIRFRGPEARLVKVAAERRGQSFAEWARQGLLRLAQLDLETGSPDGRPNGAARAG